MKRGAGLLIMLLLLWLLPHHMKGQITCIYADDISNFAADEWCSPVKVTYWNMTYTGVNNGTATVTIHYDWGDGSSQTEATTEIRPEHLPPPPTTPITLKTTCASTSQQPPLSLAVRCVKTPWWKRMYRSGMWTMKTGPM